LVFPGGAHRVDDAPAEIQERLRRDGKFSEVIEQGRAFEPSGENAATGSGASAGAGRWLRDL
jgi:hypothetical protein